MEYGENYETPPAREQGRVNPPHDSGQDSYEYVEYVNLSLAAILSVVALALAAGFIGGLVGYYVSPPADNSAVHSPQMTDQSATAMAQKDGVSFYMPPEAEMLALVLQDVWINAQMDGKDAKNTEKSIESQLLEVMQDGKERYLVLKVDLARNVREALQYQMAGIHYTEAESEAAVPLAGSGILTMVESITHENGGSGSVDVHTKENGATSRARYHLIRQDGFWGIQSIEDLGAGSA